MDIQNFRELCHNNAIMWTTHVLMRLQERGIHPGDIKSCILSGEIIEYYPDDYPYPSCLILGFSVSGRVIHTVIGIGSGRLWLVTAYHPDPEKWNPSYKKRKKEF